MDAARVQPRYLVGLDAASDRKRFGWAVAECDDGGAHLGIRPGQEPFQIRPAAQDHPRQDPCPARKAASSRWIRRAASWAARAWASCWAMTEA